MTTAREISKLAPRRARPRAVLCVAMFVATACSSGDPAGNAQAGAGGTAGALASGGAREEASAGSAGSGGNPESGGATGTAGASTAGSATGGAAESAAGTSGAGASAGGASAYAGAGGTNGGAGGTNGGASGAGASSGGAGGGASRGGSGGGPTCANVASTATRPQLSGAEAAKVTVAKYLAGADAWDPTAGLSPATGYTADAIVASDGTSTYKTLQAAVSAVATGSARRYIQVQPGTYRGKVTYTGSTPLTIYSTDKDATRVVIVNSQSATEAGGTPKSATFTSSSPGLQLQNVTVSNDFATPPSGSNIQAVALYVTGDKTVLENTRLHGFQDTLYADGGSDTRPSRVYIRSSFIEGDTDFIFGAASLVIDASELHYLSSRKGSGSGVYLAPSTRVANEYGFLVTASKFTADASAPSNAIALGRSWDQGGVSPTPNGQAVVRESTLGAHISKKAPWAAAATSGRAFSATGNRFFEYCNSGSGAGS
ncbi:MAG: pectinesterase family protein [Polyangiaceae bacterium]